MAFGRYRKTALQRERLEKLEDLRDDCIALFRNSGLTQKQIHEQGGPTPSTITKWLYKETFFPRYDTIEKFLSALGYGLTPMKLEDIQRLGNRNDRLELDVSYISKPQMPRRKKRAA